MVRRGPSWKVVSACSLLCGCEAFGEGPARPPIDAAPALSKSDGPAAASTPITDTVSCPPWPRERLIPQEGPFYFGPYPGPCTGGDERFQWSYAYVDGRVVESRFSEFGQIIAVSKYEYTEDGALVTQENVDSGFSSTIRYSFEERKLKMERAEATGDYYTAEYELSDSGYPLTRRSLSSHGEQLQEMTTQFFYRDCRLTHNQVFTRSLQPSVSKSEEDLGAVWIYGAAGEVTEVSPFSKYDYSCWQNANVDALEPLSIVPDSGVY